MKCVFDDKFRKKTIDHWKKVERENKEYQEFFKEVTNAMNPTITKKAVEKDKLKYYDR